VDSAAYTGSDLAVGIIAIIVAILVMFFAPRIGKARLAKRVTVFEFQTGLLVRKGKVERVLPPGQYSTWLTNDEIERYDHREQSFAVSGQELLTKDLLPLKLSLVTRYRISDAKLYRSSSTQPATRLYEDIQFEMRRRVAPMTLDEVMGDRERLVAGFKEAVAPAAAATGLEVTGIDLRDLVLAGPAKQAFSDIWKAQKDGQAALERARGEQASLRSLANAARMLKGNPELMNLRLMQALAGGPGKPPPTVVLGGGTGLLPVSSTPEPGGDAES
jgi:regulator of protease activity HflC (stomatin/prohibitin superfamily)